MMRWWPAPEVRRLEERRELGRLLSRKTMEAEVLELSTYIRNVFAPNRNLAFLCRFRNLLLHPQHFPRLNGSEMFHGRPVKSEQLVRRCNQMIQPIRARPRSNRCGIERGGRESFV
jgi:hypothetical protein